jgi:hypothetical protein
MGSVYEQTVITKIRRDPKKNAAGIVVPPGCVCFRQEQEARG